MYTTETTELSVHPPDDFVDQLEALLPHMRAFARSLCRNADLADDIVQEACLKACTARDRFIPGAPMKPWIFRIIRNVYIQQGRRAWRSVPLDPEDAANILSTPATQQWAADLNVMQAALEQLPKKHQDAIIVVLAAGFSYDEAGEILGCSPGTVKSRVSRAREALLHLMNNPRKRQAHIEAGIPEIIPLIGQASKQLPAEAPHHDPDTPGLRAA